MDVRRLLKVALPVDIVDKMDALLARRTGGLDSRSDFIREALDSYITELLFPPEPEKHTRPLGSPSRTTQGAQSEPPITASDGEASRGALVLKERPILISRGVAVVEQGPLFFHNRDYTSLWAAHILVELTQKRLIPFDAAVREVTKRAWRFAAELQRSEWGTVKPTVLFPTNREKREASEAAFKTFAIGTVQDSFEMLTCGGPLFIWGVCDVKREDGVVVAGLTADGWQLLSELQGLSAQMPHAAQAAVTFLKYLRQHSPHDWWGFETICKLVECVPTREQLLKGFAAEAKIRNYSWSVHQIANYVSGYISRAREWGLVEPKQLAGTYCLTAFGDHFIKTHETPT